MASQGILKISNEDIAAIKTATQASEDQISVRDHSLLCLSSKELENVAVEFFTGSETSQPLSFYDSKETFSHEELANHYHLGKTACYELIQFELDSKRIEKMSRGKQTFYRVLRNSL